MNSLKIDRSDAVVLFADLQEGIADLPLTVPIDTIRDGARALAQLARLCEIPAFVTGVAGMDGSPPHVFSQIAEGYGETPTYLRTSVDSFENDALRSAIEATGRRTVLIAGVATEVVVQISTLGAISHGFRAYVVVDASAGIDPRTEAAALARVAQAGASTVSIAGLAGELAGDFREPLAQQALGILFSRVRR